MVVLKFKHLWNTCLSTNLNIKREIFWVKEEKDWLTEATMPKVKQKFLAKRIIKPFQVKDLNNQRSSPSMYQICYKNLYNTKALNKDIYWDDLANMLG